MNAHPHSIRLPPPWAPMKSTIQCIHEDYISIWLFAILFSRIVTCWEVSEELNARVRGRRRPKGGWDRVRTAQDATQSTLGLEAPGWPPLLSVPTTTSDASAHLARALSLFVSPVSVTVVLVWRTPHLSVSSVLCFSSWHHSAPLTQFTFQYTNKTMIHI